MSEKLSGCWFFIGEDWWGSRKLYSPVLAFLGTLHVHFFMTFLLFLGWCWDRVKYHIDFHGALTYCSGCSIDIFIYFHCLKTYISPFLVFVRTLFVYQLVLFLPLYVYLLALSCFCQHTILYRNGVLEKCPSSFDNIDETRNLRAKGWPTYFLPTKREHGKVKVILSRYKRKSIFKIPKLPMTPNNIWRWTCFLSAVFLKAAAYWK